MSCTHTHSVGWYWAMLVACGGVGSFFMLREQHARAQEVHTDAGQQGPGANTRGGMGMHKGMHGSGAMSRHHGMSMSSASAAGVADFHSTQFVGSGVCATCHDGIRDAAGNDVSLRRAWAPTMMANATRDPFWRAKVRSELIRAPGLSTEIGEACTRCHAPMANVEAHAANVPSGVFDGGFLDPSNANHAAALDGVSCTLCHRIADDPSLGKPESFTGGYVLSKDRLLFGPYRDVFAMPMRHLVGFAPAYGSHTQRSELCATCHNLRTPVADAAGRIIRSGPTEGFPEQMPYTEWLASDFANKQSCQDCHMGRTDGVVLATRPPRLSTARDDFALHDFVGGNRLMLELLQSYRAQLGIASDVDFTGILRKTDSRARERGRDRPGVGSRARRRAHSPGAGAQPERAQAADELSVAACLRALRSVGRSGAACCSNQARRAPMAASQATTQNSRPVCASNRITTRSMTRVRCRSMRA